VTPYESESLSLLRSILSAVQSGTIASPSSSTPVLASGGIADERDLDSQWGNEEVRVNPRDWGGESMKGRRMSECTPQFLDMLADTLDYFARKNAASNALTTSGKPKADFDRKAAARARGWARRLRNGWSDAAEPVGDSYGTPASLGDWPATGTDDIPFAWALPFLLPAVGAAHVLMQVVAA
jgi:hypothetical protein